jgi:hypothetical protein
VSEREELWRARLTGFDPFDALRGRRVPTWLRTTARGRQLAIQVRKRTPLDLAPLLGVEPFTMAKAAGTFLAAAARNPDTKESLADCEALAALARQADGCLGDGRWGYEFDVQTRWAYYPAGSPNLIATYFCGRGFGEAGARHNRSDWLGELHAAADFLAAEHYLDASDGPRFRYLAGTDRLVHNANLLGAGLVGASAALRSDERLLGVARRAADTTIAAQRDDGSWPYGSGDSLGWEDNFHTAYNLDGLLLLWLSTGGDDAIAQVLERGAKHWAHDYFGPDGAPWYSPERHFPLDIHSAGTAMDVGARLASWGFLDPALPSLVEKWTLANLYDATNHKVLYQISRWYGRDHRVFPRWGGGHFAVGRASIGLLPGEERSPIETVIGCRTGVSAASQT